MAMLGEVFGSLGSMSLLQLLLAFIACGGYAFGQGSLLPAAGRRIAWAVTAGAAIAFTIESPDWTLSAMLLGFAVAGLGAFVAIVWLTSRVIGFGREPHPALAEVPVDSSFPFQPEPRARAQKTTGPAPVV